MTLVNGPVQPSQPNSWRHWNELTTRALNLQDMYESNWVRKLGSTCAWYKSGSKTGAW